MSKKWTFVNFIFQLAKTGTKFAVNLVAKAERASLGLVRANKK